MNRKKLSAAITHFGKSLWDAFQSEAEFKHRRRNSTATSLNPAGEYKQWIQVLHEVLIPKIYLEIGVHTGATLGMADRSEKVIGIDPAFSIKSSVRNAVLERCTSDEFFTNRVASVLNGATIDLCFIDGLHEYRQVVRDVLNCATHCTSNSLIVLHDVVPPDDKSALAKRKTKLWPGDVYKALPFLVDSFPGLNITFIRTAPTGLAFLTSVDTIATNSMTDRILTGNDDSLDKFDNLSVHDFMSQWLPRFQTIEDDFVDISTARELIKKQFATSDLL